jgi:hypothetical protein
VPLATAPFFGAVQTPLLTMQGWCLLPMLLLAPDAIRLSRASAVKVCIGIVAVTAAVLLAAPAVALLRYIPGTEIVTVHDREERIHAKVMAERVTELWHQATGGRPLAIVADGWRPQPYEVTFYSPDHPDSLFAYNLAWAPWITTERLRREGWLTVCPLEDQPCVSEGMTFAAGRQPLRLEFDAPPTTFLGWHRAAQRYVVLLFLPQDLAAK